MSEVFRCPVCDGSGKVYDNSTSGTNISIISCQSCYGKGYVVVDGINIRPESMGTKIKVRCPVYSGICQQGQELCKCILPKCCFNGIIEAEPLIVEQQPPEKSMVGGVIPTNDMKTCASCGQPFPIKKPSVWKVHNMDGTHCLFCGQPLVQIPKKEQPKQDKLVEVIKTHYNTPHSDGFESLAKSVWEFMRNEITNTEDCDYISQVISRRIRKAKGYDD